jgi:PAS domain S-box-containing protein
MTGNERFRSWSDDEERIANAIRDIIQEKEDTIQALRRSETRRRATLDVIPDLMFQISEDGTFLDYKAAAVDELALPPDAFLGKKVQEVMPPRFAQQVMRYAEQALQTGEMQIFEGQLPVAFPDVDMRDYEVRLVVGGEREVLTIVRDITERKRAEEALAAERSLLRTLVDHLPDAIYVKDDTCRKTLANPADVRNMGASSEAEVLDKTDFDFYPHDLAAAFYADDQCVIQSGRPVLNREEMISLPDGTRGWQLTSKVAVRDSTGQVVGLVGIGHDITERKRGEEALSESEEKYRDVVERANDGITIIQDGMVQYANARLVEMWGGTVEEVIGTPFTRYIHPDEMPKVLDLYKRRMAGEDFPAIYETVLRHRDGSKAYAELNGGKITFQGRPADLVIVRDITERKRAEEEVRRQAARLEALRQVSLKLATELDLDVLLRSIVERAIALVGGRWGSFELCRPELDALVSTAMPGNGPDLSGTPLRRGEGLAGKIWESGQPLVVDDYQHWEGRAAAYEGHPIRAMVGVPVRWGDEFLGVLNIESGTVGAFTSADADLLNLFAAQAAIAIHNARLFEAERAAREQAEALHRATQALSATLDLQQVFALILSELRQVVAYDSASVQQLEGDRLVIIGGRGFPNLEELLGVRFDLAAGDNPNAEVIRSRAPLILKDAPAAYPAFRHEPHTQAGIRAWLGVPLLFGDCLIGMLALDKRTPDFYTGEHARLAEAFAVQAAIAIENARLYDEAQRHNRELALLNRVIAASAAGQAIELILETVCRELAAYFEVPQSAAALFDENKTQAVVVAEYLTPGRPSALGESIPVADNPASQHLLTHKTPLVIDNAQADPRQAPIRDLIWRRGTVSLLLLPLIVDGEVLGILGLATLEPRPFSSDEVALAQRVAEAVSGALAHARLEEAQRRLSTAVEQSAEAVVITDTNGTILYVNPTFEHSSGYSHAEAIGQHLSILRSSKHDAAFYREMSQTLTGGRVWQGRMVHKKKDGSLFTADMTMTPARDRAGEITNYVATMRDVTREVELEEQVRQAQKMEAVGRLAGGITHDFNNLLSVIHLSASLMERKLRPGDPTWEYLERIRETTRRATNLTRQLLTFSHQEVVEVRVLNLNAVIGETSKLVRQLIGEDIELVLELAEDLWSVAMDPTQVDQILMNLSVNARDAMPEGGRLTLATANVVLDEAYAAQHIEAEPREHVLLSIADTGMGMDDEAKVHLFEPFYTTKEPGQGTGLGLATVYGIVKQNGGHIEVSSEVGSGTIFRIYLPRDEAEQAQEPSEPAPTGARRGTETILVVEDRADLRRLAEQVLSMSGYQVVTASEGVEALRLSEEYRDPIHLLFTDLVMPDMTGKDLADRLRRQRPEMRVLYMSGYADRPLVKQIRVEQSASFLSKPFTVEELTQKVRAVLES